MMEIACTGTHDYTALSFLAMDFFVTDPAKPLCVAILQRSHIGSGEKKVGVQ